MAKVTIPTQTNPNVVAIVATNNVYTNIKPMHIYDDVEGVEDVFTIRLNKKKKKLSNVRLIGQ
jgi:hypothetical protein